MTKYSINDIDLNKVLKFPKIKELPGYQREMTWNIMLKQEISSCINLEDMSRQISHQTKERSHKNLRIKMQIVEGKNLSVYIKTTRNPNIYAHDHLAIAIRHMLDIIEELLGEIDTVEGKKFQDIWKYHRRSKL